MSHAVDDFSECTAGLEVEIRASLGMLGEPNAAQHYLADDHTARAEIPVATPPSSRSTNDLKGRMSS